MGWPMLHSELTVKRREHSEGVRFGAAALYRLATCHLPHELARPTRALDCRHPANGRAAPLASLSLPSLPALLCSLPAAIAVYVLARAVCSFVPNELHSKKRRTRRRSSSSSSSWRILRQARKKPRKILQNTERNASRVASRQRQTAGRGGGTDNQVGNGMAR